MAEKEYIEREAFLEKERKRYCEGCSRRQGMKNGKYKTLYKIGEAPCRACEIYDVMDDAEEFPAADVWPVVRGKWEDVEVTYVADKTTLPFERISSMRCNQCNRYHTEIYYYGNPTEMAHYCPNCGADMREES